MISETSPQKIPKTSETKTLSEQVFNDLKDAIIAGELTQGSKITEDGLSKSYGISRGPLREALRRLEAARLLVRVPRAGMRVITLTTEIMEEIYTVREALDEEKNTSKVKAIWIFIIELQKPVKINY